MKYWYYFVIIALGLALLTSWKYNKDAQKKWETAMANIKAYDSELSGLKEKSTAYQLTINQLKYSKDSVLKKLEETRKELKIKDKNVQSVQYIESTFTKTDTILMRDTLFKEPSLSLDTLFGDRWYKIRLGLHYPSSITIQPEFKSEKHIIVSTKKETVNPPKKLFLFRWFQKKHTVLKVDVVEKNPYIDNSNSRFIKVVR